VALEEFVKFWKKQTQEQPEKYLLVKEKAVKKTFEQPFYKYYSILPYSIIYACRGSLVSIKHHPDLN
jgi:hypothetical protein